MSIRALPASSRPARPRAAARPRSPRRLEIRCADCGYGGVVGHLPSRCPMCGGKDWELHAAGRSR